MKRSLLMVGIVVVIAAFGKSGLYERCQSEKKPDGTWSDVDGIIMDIYAYVYESGDVVSSGKTHWGDIGSEDYRKATKDSY